MTDTPSASIANSIDLNGCYKTRCNICGKKHGGDLAHFFYFDDHEYQCCGRCTRHIPHVHRQELRGRDFHEPDAQQPLWRYMELPKFVDLIVSRRLWFSQVASLEDRFEGALSSKARQPDWQRWMREYAETVIRNPPPRGETGVQLSESRIAEEADRLYEEIESALSRQKRIAFVSCWHMADHESFLMWKVYAAGQSDSVCVKTSLDRMSKSITRSCSVGVVQYIDFSRAFSDVNWPFLYKRAAFKQESEARIFLREWHLDQAGFHLKVDPQTLIEEVVFSPDAPVWFIETTRKLISLADLDLSTRVSDLNEEPF